MTQAKDDSEIPGTVAYESARAERLQEIIDKQAARLVALEAALRDIAKWSRQHPEANAGDHAGEELLAIVRRIAALAPEQDK